MYLIKNTAEWEVFKKEHRLKGYGIDAFPVMIEVDADGYNGPTAYIFDMVDAEALMVASIEQAFSEALERIYQNDPLDDLLKSYLNDRRGN